MNFKDKTKIVIFWLGLALVWPGVVLAMTITLSVPEKYAEVVAGEQVFFETDVKWPENDDRKDLRIEYYIKDKDNQEIAYSKVLKAIETQASFMDSMTVPETIKPGMYTVTAKISDYQAMNQEVGSSFNVAKKGDSAQTYLFIIVGVLSLVVTLVVIQLFILMRRKRG